MRFKYFIYCGGGGGGGCGGGGGGGPVRKELWRLFLSKQNSVGFILREFLINWYPFIRLT